MAKISASKAASLSGAKWVTDIVERAAAAGLGMPLMQYHVKECHVRFVEIDRRRWYDAATLDELLLMPRPKRRCYGKPKQHECFVLTAPVPGMVLEGPGVRVHRSRVPKAS